MQEILIFKTSVNSKEEVELVGELFDMDNSIKKCSFDLDDPDRILRVECLNISPEFIEDLLEFEGIYCTNMEY